jgi:predicted RNase H-like HicB family nuclease
MAHICLKGANGDRKRCGFLARCYDADMSEKLIIETDREDDGRWLAEIPALPGTMSYGGTRDEAIARVQALALRVLAARIEHGEPDSIAVFSSALSAPLR